MLKREEEGRPTRNSLQTVINHFNPNNEDLPYIRVPLTGGTISISMPVIVCLAMLVIIYMLKSRLVDHLNFPMQRIIDP